MTTEKFKIDKDAVWKDVDGRIYILQPEREEIHALNETGTLIWRLISKGKSLSEITKAFTAEYDVTAGQAEKDILEFVNQYIREKLLSKK